MLFRFPVRSVAIGPLLGLLGAATFLVGCALPLGPGFRLPAQQVEVSTVSAAPAHIHVHIVDSMINAGNRDLAYLDVKLPLGAAFAAENLRIRVNDREIDAATGIRESGVPFRVRFDPPWQQKQTQSIVFDYDLEPRLARGTGIGANGFFLADLDAFPSWLPPAGAFVRADSRARDEKLHVTVPDDFRVLAAGHEERRTEQGSATTYEFRIPGAGFPTFVIAGRYQERRIETQHGAVVFWTLHPTDARAAFDAAGRLVATAATFRQIFGPVGASPETIHIVEMPVPVTPDTLVTSSDAVDTDSSTSGISAASFPEGVLLDQRAIAQGMATEPVLRVAEYELARTWFGWHVRTDPESETLLGRGIGLFAVVLAAEARGGDAARQREIARLMASYDRGRPSVADRDAGQQRVVSNAYGAALFFVALEDIAGKQKFSLALRRVIGTMADQEIGIEDVRSALEAETKRDLADTFRVWLNRSDLPADFRARYTAAP